MNLSSFKNSIYCPFRTISTAQTGVNTPILPRLRKVEHSTSLHFSRTKQDGYSTKKVSTATELETLRQSRVQLGQWWPIIHHSSMAFEPMLRCPRLQSSVSLLFEKSTCSSSDNCIIMGVSQVSPCLGQTFPRSGLLTLDAWLLTALELSLTTARERELD